MNPKRRTNLLRLALIAGCALAGATHQVRANSYASSLTNNAGEVSFRLNDAADSVKIIGNNGALTVNLGALPRGLTITNLASQGLTAGVFKVVVAKQGEGAVAKIGPAVAFNSPRGVTVNQNPASPYFGWVYVANSAAGTKGDGMFAFTADLFDILGQGATAKTADLAANFATGTGSSPYRPKVGWSDDKVYVADWSDGAGNLYRFLPDLSADPAGSYVLQPLQGTAAVPVVRDGVQNNNHGSVTAVEVLGSLGTGDMQVYTIDEDYQSDPTVTALTEMNSLWRYDVGSGPTPWANPPNALIGKAPITFASQEMDLSYSPATGYFYMSDRRDNGTEASVYVYDKDGNRLFSSLQASQDLGLTRDVLVALRGGCAASPDGKYFAALNTSNNLIVMPMIQGIPDLASRTVFNLGSTTTIARGVSFDRANNVYVVSSGMAILQAVSIGYTATNTTSSDGTFTQEAAAIPTARVTAESFDAGAGVITALNEAETAVVGTIRVSRSGVTDANPLAVNFTTGGTATRGTASTGDYFLRVNGAAITGNTVTIPSGTNDVLIEVVANNDDISEPAETITFAVAAGFYGIATPSSASLTITDNDPTVIEISEVTFNRMFEGNPFDRLRYTLQRLGDPALGPIEVHLTYSGTAISGTDYTPTNNIVIESGELTKTFDVLVLPDTTIEPVETVTVAVAAGTGYTIGTNNVLTAGATGVIVDDDLPAENVLYSENFSSDVSANWTIFGASASGEDDYTATFGYNYAELGIPPAPHSAEGDTFGLLMSANKVGTPGEAAAVNAYATGKDFTGNYAVRFDMYLRQSSSAGTTEHALFGLNHSGTKTNWFSNGAGVPAGWEFDGIFAAIVTDASNLGDYVLFTGPRASSIPGPTTVASRAATTLEQVFHNPPWTPGGGAGSPGNDANTTTPSWAQVELRYENGVVTLSINATNIFSYTNSTPSTHGTVMLGYADTFASVGLGSGVIYDNLRVVSLESAQPTEVRITTTTRVGSNLQIDFTAGTSDTTASFKVASATTVTGPYTVDDSITVTQVSPGAFRVSVPIDAGNRFVQIRRVP